jgi:hypothetical protein
MAASPASARNIGTLASAGPTATPQAPAIGYSPHIPAYKKTPTRITCRPADPFIAGGGIVAGRLTGRPLLRSGLRHLAPGAVAVAVPSAASRPTGGHVTR